MALKCIYDGNGKKTFFSVRLGQRIRMRLEWFKLWHFVHCGFSCWIWNWVTVRSKRWDIFSLLLAERSVWFFGLFFLKFKFMSNIWIEEEKSRSVDGKYEKIAFILRHHRFHFHSKFHSKQSHRREMIPCDMRQHCLYHIGEPIGWDIYLHFWVYRVFMWISVESSSVCDM